MYLFSYIPSTANTLPGRAGPVHENTLSVAFDEAPSLACRVLQISKICWISKLRIASNFQAKRSDSKDSEKRWLKGMPGYSWRAIFGCLHLSSCSKSLLSWVLGYWVQGFNLSSSRLSHGTRILKQSWNLATTTTKKKNVGKKSQSLESTGLQPTWPEAASPTHSSTSPKFLPWPCAGCRKSRFHWRPFCGMKDFKFFLKRISRGLLQAKMPQTDSTSPPVAEVACWR